MAINLGGNFGNIPSSSMPNNNIQNGGGTQALSLNLNKNDILDWMFLLQVKALT